MANLTTNGCRFLLLLLSFTLLCSLSFKLKDKLCVCVCAQLCQTLSTPWTAAHQAPLSMEFSRQETWSGLPFPPPGDLPNLGIEPLSLASPALPDRFFTTAPLVSNRYLLSSFSRLKKQSR